MTCKTMREYATEMAKHINKDGTVSVKYYENMLAFLSENKSTTNIELSALKDLSAQIRGVDWRENYE